jgi:hypothetical protein
VKLSKLGAAHEERVMSWRTALVIISGMLIFEAAGSQTIMRFKLALVALTEGSDVRVEFEDGLAAKFRANNYDAAASYEIIPDVGDLDNADIVRRLSDAGAEGIVMMRPAAVGAGSSLKSVRDEVSEEVYANMRAFAKEISPSTDEDDLIAVIHTASYVIRRGKRAELLSSGAVWLDMPFETQVEGIAKLQDLIVANMNKARPAFREYLGLPPLPKE